MKEVVFLDFDGVIVDSIKECYKISLETFFGFNNLKFINSEYELLFNKNRYLVRPVYQYMVLHQVLLKFLNNEILEEEIKEYFYKLDKKIKTYTKDNFEYSFFSKRKFHQQNLVEWLKMHNITKFGETLKNKKLDHYYIITTKDKESVLLLCDFFKINIKNIFGKELYNLKGSKGEIMTNFIDNSDYDSAIFIDDAIEHLNGVKDKRIKVYFADWAYDKKPNKFNIYKF